MKRNRFDVQDKHIFATENYQSSKMISFKNLDLQGERNVSKDWIDCVAFVVCNEFPCMKNFHLPLTI